MAVGGLRGGVGGLYGVLGDGQPLGHLGHRHPCVDHLLDAACPLGVGEVLLWSFSTICCTTRSTGCAGFIAGGGGQHIDRDAGQSGFAGGKGAPLPVADADTVPSGRAHRRSAPGRRVL